MFVGADDGEILLHSFLTDMEVRDFKQMPLGSSVVFAPDGKSLATAIMARKNAGEPPQPILVLWSLFENKPLWWDESHGGEIQSIAFSGDGKTIATATGDLQTNDRAARIFNAQTGEKLGQIKHDAPVMSIALAPDGKQMLTVTADQKWRLFETASGKEIATSGTQPNGWSSVHFSPDGNQFAIADSSALNLYNAADGGFIRRFGGLSYETYGGFFAPDGTTIITNNYYSGRQRDFVKTASGVSFWSAATGGEKSRLPTEFGGLATASSADGKLLLVSEFNAAVLWNAAENIKLRRFENKEAGADDILTEITSAAVSPDNKRILTGHGSISARGKNYAILWNAENAAQIRRWETGGTVNTAAFSPDGKLILLGSGDNVFQEGELVEQEKSGVLIDALQMGEIRKFDGNRAAFSPDGKFILVFGDASYSAHLFDAANFQKIRTFSAHRDEILTASFSADGKLLATAGRDDVIRLWNTATGKEIRKIPSRAGVHNSLSIRRDNRFLLTLGDDGTMHLRLIETGERLCRLVSFPDETWVTIDEAGRFDTNNFEAIRGLHWVAAEEPMRALPIEIYLRDYYEPGLLTKILEGEKLRPARYFAALNRAQPRLNVLPNFQTNDDGTVTVTVEAESGTSEIQKDKQGKPFESGVFDVRLFRAGQLVGYSTGEAALRKTFKTFADSGEELSAWREANKLAPNANCTAANGKYKCAFRVRLPTSASAKEIEFSAYAFNSDRIKSETARAVYRNNSAKVVPRRAYVVVFGVNKYQSPGWDLQFAANDARAMREILSDRLRRAKDYAEVVEIPLVSDDETVNNQTTQKRDATKTNVRTVLELLAGKTPDEKSLKTLTDALGAETVGKIKQANPEDAIFISFSSHGYADRNGVFYILPTDIGANMPRAVTNELLKNSISSDELSLWLRAVDAGNMTMIVDACNAEAAVKNSEFKPAPMGSRGLGQLAGSFSNTFRVSGYKSRAHKFYFYAGEQVDIEVFGDGDTNLDLYIYDAYGNLCAKRTGSSDYESVDFDVYRSEYFTIKVVNRGDVYNDYELNVDAY